MILLVAWGGYRVFIYYKEIQEQRWVEKEESSGKNVEPSKLAGVPYNLETSLQHARTQGATSMKRWLEQFGSQIQDPRKAWIQLDYCTLIASEDPQEARAVYSEVKQRLREGSPVYPRLKQLQKSFE